MLFRSYDERHEGLLATLLIGIIKEAKRIGERGFEAWISSMNVYSFLTTAGGKVVPITTKAENGFTYATREQIEPLINEKTRAICCISPGNPTGNVLTLDEMKLIGEIAKEHDLFIIADEVYREFAYDDCEDFC